MKQISGTNMPITNSRIARLTARTMVALFAAGALVAASACKSTDESAPDSAVAPAVLGAQDVATASRTDIASGIVLTGSLRPSEVVNLRAQVPGTITGLRVDRGSRVTDGQVLAVIAAAGIRGQAAGARAAVASAEASLALAKQRLEAARTLRDAGAMSAIDFQSAQAAYEAADAQLAAAKAQSAGASEAAARASVRAPISGVVSSRSVEEGESVSPGDDILTVVNSRTLELSGQIPVEEASRVRVGQAVVFTLEGSPQREYRGSVARIDPTANEQTRQVGVYVQLPNSSGSIVGGQFATGRIVGDVSENAIVIPTAAVRESSGSQYVLAIVNGRIERRDVVLGARDDSRGVVAVKSGIAEGDKVVVTQGAELTQGEAVTVANDASGAPAGVPATPPGER